jgi:putative heme-binding domain-containing protein
MAGSADIGGTLFEKECATCHRIGKTGHAIGPDLTSSSWRDPEALLTHVLDPNRYVLPNYLQYIVVDVSGRTHTGLIASQSANGITLKREKNATQTILRHNIEEIVATGKSLMPEGFEKTIDRQQMADLLAFLQSAQVTTPAADRPLDIGTEPGLVEPQ